MMNKGLEVIEAHYLFGTAYDDIDVVGREEGKEGRKEGGRERGRERGKGGRRVPGRQ